MTSCKRSSTTWKKCRSTLTSRRASPVTPPTRSCSASPLGRNRLRPQLPRARSGSLWRRRRLQRRQTLPNARSSWARRSLPVLKPSRARPARRRLNLQRACRRRSPRPHQGGTFAGPGTQQGGSRLHSHRAARHALPRQAMLPRERLTQQRQLERDLPGPLPLPPPSGQGILLLHLAAPEEGRTSIFPRSAPTRRKKSKFLWCSCSSSILLFYLVSDLLQSGLLSFQDAGPESGEEGQGRGDCHRRRPHCVSRGWVRDHLDGPGNHSSKQPPAQPPA